MATTRVRLLVAAALCACLPLARTIAADRSVSAMTAAATAFLAELRPDQRATATFALADAERLRWHFIPNESFPRKGLALRGMSDAQRAKAHDLLRAGLSQRGYLTATAIIGLEDVLRAIEGGVRMARDPVDYQFTVFGTPGGSAPWAWRVEGHHLSLHFTIAGRTVVATSPAFTGANPAEVRDGDRKGTRVLAPLEDLARALVTSLDAGQRGTAVLEGAAPGDILTMNRNDIAPLAPAGLAASAMTAAQREAMMRLIEAYTGLVADDLAADRMARLRSAGLDRIAFAWAGPLERGAKHYYRVQGPTFLIEYDNTQNDGNHVHAVWRDFQGDFGRDLLGEHLRAQAH
jgi:hypothetical protein